MFYLHTNPLMYGYVCTKNRQPLVIRNKLTYKQLKRGLEELIDSRMMFGGTGPRVEVSGVETVS